MRHWHWWWCLHAISVEWKNSWALKNGRHRREEKIIAENFSREVKNADIHERVNCHMKSSFLHYIEFKWWQKMSQRRVKRLLKSIFLSLNIQAIWNEIWRENRELFFFFFIIHHQPWASERLFRKKEQRVNIFKCELYEKSIFIISHSSDSQRAFESIGNRAKRAQIKWTIKCDWQHEKDENKKFLLQWFFFLFGCSFIFRRARDSSFQFSVLS